MLAGMATPPLDLMCTTRPGGNVIRFRFSIDTDKNTFSGQSASGGRDYPVSGLAAVSDSLVLLTTRGEKITTVYRISRVTGDLEMEMGLNEQPPVERISGSCQKFAGNAL